MYTRSGESCRAYAQHCVSSHHARRIHALSDVSPEPLDGVAVRGRLTLPLFHQRAPRTDGFHETAGEADGNDDDDDNAMQGFRETNEATQNEERERT